MKTVKILLSVLVMLAFSGLNKTLGQWAFNGNQIFNTNTENVGIGTNLPGKLLDVSKNMVEPTIRVFNNGGAGGASFQMMDLISGADWKFKATNNGGFKIRDNGYALDVIVVEPNSANNSLYINDIGFVGLGTASPTFRLHTEGDIKLRDSYAFLYVDNITDNANSGVILQYNNSNRAWMFYDEGETLLRLNCDAGGGSRNDLVIKSDGRICMGTATAAAGYKLSVNGKVVCTEVLVEALADWPDYVFSEQHSLMSLPELEQSILENQHLPGLPSAVEVNAKGFELGDMQIKVLEKVEELTLYTIQQGKQIEELTTSNLIQGKLIEELQIRLSTLEKENLEAKTSRQ